MRGRGGPIPHLGALGTLRYPRRKMSRGPALSPRPPLAALALLLLGGGASCQPDPGRSPEGASVETRWRALGEPQDGFPNWYERAVHVWTNRARSDPAADLASCSVCAEKSCYAPVPPVVWNHNLARAARFHSDNLVKGSCGLQHDSPCTLVSGVSTAYTPGPCDGAPACACQGGTASCGSTGTVWSSRVSAFGTSPNAENIARGYNDPVSTFYLWLHEPDTNAACGFRNANGHRYNILTSSRRALGVGKSGSTYTQDFSGTGTPAGVVAGVHYPLTGSTIHFRANWYGANAPTTAYVNIDGMCQPMSLERGSTTNGTYLFSASNVPNTCVRYYFHFMDASGDHYYPTVGSYGINCGAADWENSRGAACGPCTASCAGRACGSDGCGGSCGSCAGGEVCNPSGQCVCPVSECAETCVDTNTDPANCGQCGRACGAGEYCGGGACLCAPVCGGRQCGDDACGGSCGSCGGGQVCNSSGQCACASGATLCAGSCVDTSSNVDHCGGCGTRCRGQTRYCVAGQCQATPGNADAGTPDASAPDAGAPGDASAPLDAGAPDASAPGDASAPPPPDATPGDDAETEPVSDGGGLEEDGGSPTLEDGGVAPVDLGSPADAGTVGADAPALADAGPHTVPPRPGPDATVGAVGADAGEDGSSSGGCGLIPGESSSGSAPSLVLLCLAALRARRRRGRVAR